MIYSSKIKNLFKWKVISLSPQPKSMYQTNHQNADLIGLKLIDEAQ